MRYLHRGILAFCVVYVALALVACAPLQRGPFPYELAQDCLVGSKLGTATNQELTESLTKLAATLKQCNLDKKGLRSWAGESSP